MCLDQPTSKNNNQNSNQNKPKKTAPTTPAPSSAPSYFAQHFLNFQPEPPQVHVLENAHFKRRIILNCNRQWGKSTIAAILITHRLFTNPGCLVLIIAPAGRQSGEAFLKVKRYLRHSLHQTFTTDGINRDSVLLNNGSRLVALPAIEETTRCFSAVSLMLFDEASNIDDDVYLAFRPMVAVGNGDIMIISTPRGRKGFFYREMAGLNQRTAPQWFRHTGPVTECVPRISEEFIEDEKSLGDSHFRQEWLCEFLRTAIYTFDEETLQKAVKRELDSFQWL